MIKKNTMIKKITTIIMLALSVNALNAQIILTDNFTSPWNASTLGWTIINNSQPIGTSSVAQGNGTVFPAYNGAANDYVTFNYNNVLTQGGISTWLITPSLTLSNGSILEFATRTNTVPLYADRLQIRMSPVNSNVIPSGTTSVGSFTNLLLDINPNLNLLTSSVVVNNAVNGYPTSWTIYTIAISGLPAGSVTGRFAFRYFVNNGGSGGANSDIIGLDAVKYTVCLLPVSIASSASVICSGGTVNLTASGANSYTWNTGSTNSSIAPSPSANVSYTVIGTNNAGCNGIATTSITVNPTPTLSIIGASGICTGQNASLTAVGATSYTWNTGSTSTSIVTTPSVNTTYSLIGTSSLGCTSTTIQLVTVQSSLSISIVGPSTICFGNTANLSGLGGVTYTWNTGAITTTIAPTLTTTTTFSIIGASGTCSNSAVKTISVNAIPSVSVVSSTSLTCAGETLTLTASGANTYTWNTGATSAIFAPSPTVSVTYTVIGTNTLGCDGVASISITVNACAGLINNPASSITTMVYPNPNTGSFIVQLNNGSVKIIELIDITGRIVLAHTSLNDKIEFDINTLANGVYYVKVQSNNSVEVIKIVKQ